MGNAKLAGLANAIDLSGNKYNWLATVFYIAYILSQWTIIGWKKFPAHIWASSAVFLWGLDSTLQATVKSWGSLMVCRVFLGIVEAAFAPGVPLYLSFFYSREKVGFRIGKFIVLLLPGLHIISADMVVVRNLPCRICSSQCIWRRFSVWNISSQKLCRWTMADSLHR